MGGQGESFQYLKRHGWQLSVGYRRLAADDWFVGAQSRPDLAPGGEPLNFAIHTVDLTAMFAVTERFNLALTVPFISGRFSAKIWPDGLRHTQSSSGAGDVSLVGSVWLQNPATHSEGNVALGVGVKAPTGSNTVSSPYYTATGSVPFTAHQGIEPGDGGWGIILQAQAYRKVFSRAFAYVSGSYLLSPRAVSGVAARFPGDSSWSVPDIYSGRLGLAYALWPDEGISVSLGGRIDGLPVHDLVGGGDNGFRQPGYVIFVDPGVAVARGREAFTLSVPVRVHANRLRNTLEWQGGKPGGGGDFAKAVVFLGYSHRF
ncbi:MAG: hypothetical protein DMD52_09850 [Gemmatimonadetes bacterium]|nr:MAG: hypothetical protein DMD52_09850 [Gemmatimonadota bacterium]